MLMNERTNMIQIYLTLNGLDLQIETSSRDILYKIKDHFSYMVPGAMWTPQYKAGAWDGKICLFNTTHRRLPYGFLFELIDLLKRNNCEVKAEDAVKKLFGDKSFNPDDVNYDLLFYPRYYQKDAIEKALKYKSGLIISPTASGKSVCISYVISHLIRNEKIQRALIIVPTTSLVVQFYEQMIEYKIPEELVGKFYADSKDWDKPILISTWQSLTVESEKTRKSEISSIRKSLRKKSIKKDEKAKLTERLNTITSDEYIENVNRLDAQRESLLKSIDAVIVDEVQTAKSKMVSSLLRKTTNAEYRLGFTGTLPEATIDTQQIKSYLGPVIVEYGVDELTQAGFVNPCNVNIINIEYDKAPKGKLNEIKDQLFESDFRNDVLCSLVESPQNYLFLVSRIEKEGKPLERLLKERFPDYQIKFLNSSISVNEREIWRKKCMNEDKIILIAIYSLFQAGIDMPGLQNVVLASSYKSKVRILQSIGRSLRKNTDKGTSQIFDICDKTRYLTQHSRKRIEFYENERFNITRHKFKEGEMIS